MNRTTFALVITFATLASAEETVADPSTTVSNLVQKVLVAPLISKERVSSRLTRARLPPQTRRVRVLDGAAQRDAEGQLFYRFSIDARFNGLVENDSWVENQMAGCAYPSSGKVFVLKSDTHFPSALLLGKKVAAAEKHICRVAAEIAEVR